MNFLIIFIAIILVLIIFFSRNVEKMVNVNPIKKCCLVEKKYLPDDKSLNGGNFKYVYNSKEKDECDQSSYDTNNKQLLIDGVNNWSNEKCSNNSGLGSCRMINNEEDLLV
jgi:hypothetical protein